MVTGRTATTISLTELSAAAGALTTGAGLALQPAINRTTGALQSARRASLVSAI
jgi:hypothetical protein